MHGEYQCHFTLLVSVSYSTLVVGYYLVPSVVLTYITDLPIVLLPLVPRLHFW